MFAKIHSQSKSAVNKANQLHNNRFRQQLNPDWIGRDSHIDSQQLPRQQSKLI